MGTWGRNPTVSRYLSRPQRPQAPSNYFTGGTTSSTPSTPYSFSRPWERVDDPNDNNAIAVTPTREEEVETPSCNDDADIFQCTNEGCQYVSECELLRR